MQSYADDSRPVRNASYFIHIPRRLRQDEDASEPRLAPDVEKSDSTDIPRKCAITLFSFMHKHSDLSIGEASHAHTRTEDLRVSSPDRHYEYHAKR